MGRLGDPLIDYQSNRDSVSTTFTVENICDHTNGTTYNCAKGYCCDGMCCSHYYELWWFWFIWVLAIFLSFCCAYHHKHKNRQSTFRTTPLYGVHDTYSGVCGYPGPPLDNKSEMMGYTKLPIYDDVIRIPPTASPPPPYMSRRQPVNTVAYVQRDEDGTSLQVLECNVTSSMLSLASLSHYIPDILSKANISFQLNRLSNSSSCSAIDNHTDAGITASMNCSKDEAEVKNEEDKATASSSSRNSVVTNKEDFSRVIVQSLTAVDATEYGYDSDSDTDDNWLLRNGDTDPNNNNVVVEIEKGYEPENDAVSLPKTQDISPMASIQDLIEDPQAY